MEKKVSIVICTYNRGDFLKRTLKSLSNLNYKNFEVIVVNGPSTDDTENILKRYNKVIKKLNNTEANLSKSRNMGIKASAGEIVAFIDDDAIPDPNWLKDITSLYSDDTVGGVGGKVYGPGDDHFQFEKGYVDFWGDADVHYFGEDYNDPKGKKFNMMLGTNCTFLRKAIISIGGFDEYFDYFHDESDACLRLVQSGYKILNHPRAYIHHEFAKSHIRQSTFDGCRLNWYPIIKNKVYFALKNSKGLATDKEREEKVNEIKKTYLEYYKIWEREKKITKVECANFSKLCKDGFQRGYIDGKEKERQINYDLDQTSAFLLFDSSKIERCYNICLLCKDNIFDAIGGTAKYTYELSKGFVKAGHNVHVITKGNGNSDWLQDGINVHSIINEKILDIESMKEYPTAYDNLQYSYCAYKKIVELNKKFKIDIVETVLWDFEGAVAAHLLKGRLPVVVRLQTPLLKVAETQNWRITEDFKLFSDFEAQMIRDASGVIAISDHIKETISELYHIDFEQLKTRKVYLGVDENKEKNLRKDSNLRILFVGRLERRKGIHTIFSIIQKLMEEFANLEFHFVGNNEIIDGVYKKSFKDYFYEKYGKMAWKDNVRFLGQISNEEKDREFAECDIFVAPSLYESFGIILIEAMSAAKPVIGSKIGGMQEIIKNGENGYLINVEDSNELYVCLRELLKDSLLREQFGKCGLTRFRELFSTESMVNHTLDYYREIISDYVYV